MESTPQYFMPPDDHFFLLGPRGTGKTWLRSGSFLMLSGLTCWIPEREEGSKEKRGRVSKIHFY